MSQEFDFSLEALSAQVTQLTSNIRVGRNDVLGELELAPDDLLAVLAAVLLDSFSLQSVHRTLVSHQIVFIAKHFMAESTLESFFFGLGVLEAGSGVVVAHPLRPETPEAARALEGSTFGVLVARHLMVGQTRLG